MMDALATIAEKLSIVIWGVILIWIVIFAPLAVFRKTRLVGGMGIFYSSFALGFSLWIYGALFTLYLWGWPAVIIGLVFLGVGVVPIGILALAFQGEWEWVGSLALLAAMTYGARIGGLALADRK